MIRIRNATHSDIPTMVELGEQMFAESQFKQYQYNKEKVADLVSTFIAAPLVGIVLIAEDDGKIVGLFMGGVSEHYFGNMKESYDLALYVRPEHRKSRAGWLLLVQYIKAAKALGADEVGIANSTGVDPERVATLFERAGFHKYGYIFRMNAKEQ